MEISLNYGRDRMITNIQDDKIAWITSPRHVKPCENEENEIRQAIQNPIGMKCLKEIVKEKGTKTVLMVDDLTRSTPQKKILPILIEELNNAGVAKSDIKILVALGTHRSMSREECQASFGKDIVDNFEVINHNGYNPDDLVDIGITPSGIPINVNRLYYESDISIAIGNIIPHVYAGWSGGAKMVQPGVSGPATTAKTHLIAAKYLFQILGNADNLVRKEMEEIARKTGLTMIVNTVMNSDGSLVKVVAGDIVKAHREGVEWGKKVYSSGVNSNPDIVIASAYPGDLDLWQSTKAMTSSSILAKPNGTLILVAKAEEGIPTTHPTLLELGNRSTKEVLRMVEKGEIKDEVAASVHVTMGACREKLEVILVSEKCNKDIIEKLGFKYYDNLDDAVSYTLKKHGDSYTVGISTHGADLAP